MSTPPDLSLVIPTFRRPELLGRLLDSLLVQTAGTERCEVIVVDNQPERPHPATQALCQDQRYNHLALVYLHQPEPGSSPARNLGIRHARAPLVGFVDDDETLPGDWIERVLRIHADRSPELFGGPYLPDYPIPKPAWFRDEYLTLAPSPTERWLEAGTYLLGGNMVVRKTILDQIGGFSTTLGRIGNNMEYGEETDLQMRAAALGARTWYDPELVIYHYTHPDRLRTAWFLASAWFHGKAKAQIACAKKTVRPAPWRVIISGLRDITPKSMRTIWLSIGSLFRNRRTYPAIQNYWVEVMATQVSGLSTSVFTTYFLLQKAAPKKQSMEASHA